MSKVKLSEDKQKKPVIQVSRSRPSGKKKVDLFARMRNTEHPLDNILPVSEFVDEKIPAQTFVESAPISVPPENQNEEHLKSNSGVPRTTGITGISGATKTPRTTGITGTTKISVKHPISPVRDFAKTPNSLTRVILAQGLFRGKSKQIYDYFWSVSRGAIKPVRIFRKTHKEIQKGAGIGSRNTVIDGVKHLESIGLISVASSVGMAGGNEYEIFTPDEIGYTGISGTTSITGTTGISGLTDTTETSQKPVILVQPVSGITGTTQNIVNKGSYERAKTSSNTIENNDDKAFTEMIAILAGITEKVTGKSPTKYDSAKWRELGELLAMELEVAAARTKSVSNAPAFLTEHLRRRFASKLSATSKSGSATPKVGKFKPSECEPLGDEYRLVILKTLQDFLDEGKGEFVENLQETYTTDDWTWLMQNLKRD